MVRCASSTPQGRACLLPPSSIIAYVKQVASALDYAHAQKVMHRDVKPENMLLGRNHEVLLSDFGLAMGTYSSSQERARDASGTIAYMAPEQARGKPRPASDQYALAVAVYEWLCGSRPFEGTYEEIAVQHVLHDPPSLCRLTPEISLEVEAAVLKALAKDPHQRFDTVQEFAAALELAHQSGTLPGELRSALPAGGTVRREATSSHDRTQTPAIYAVAWSADRRQIVAGGHDRVVRVRNLMNGLISLIYRGHAAGITALAWSLDGQRIASASLDKTIQVWDAANGEKIASYKGHTGMIHSVAWSPDGKRIASTGEDKLVQVWEVAKGRLISTHRGQSERVSGIAWSPDGKSIAAISTDALVQVWDVDRPSSRHAPQESSFTCHAHASSVHALVWLPDGKHIAAADGDGSVQVWQVV